MAYPEWIKMAERKVIDQLLNRALAAGLKVSVFDGEEYALDRSTDLAAIQHETGQTDETTYLFRDADSDIRIGKVFLVHGLDPDEIIADFSWNTDISDRDTYAIMSKLTEMEG